MGECAPPQRIYVLNLVEVTSESVLLTNLEGEEIRVLITWSDHDERLRGKQSDIFASWDGINECQKGWGTVVYDGRAMTIKQLGVAARRNAGLPGRTPLDVTVRILSGTRVLGLHQPLATLVDPSEAAYKSANEHCHYCKGTFYEGETKQAPFASCFYCEDAPSWHHGWCCPHNDASCNWSGPSHTQRYEYQIRGRRWEIQNRGGRLIIG